MCALIASVEGHGQAVNARQRLAQGIPVLQRIPSIIVIYPSSEYGLYPSGGTARNLLWERVSLEPEKDISTTG